MTLATAVTAILAMQVSNTDNKAGKLLEDLRLCRGVEAAAERLACLDRSTGALLDAVERSEAALIDPAMAADARRRRFGLPVAPDTNYGKVEAKAPPISELTSTVTSASGYSGGRWNVTLADGSVWQLMEPSALTPRSGHRIRIKRGAVGYFAYVSSAAPVRAKRLR